MASSPADYTPMLLDAASLATFKSDAYRAFILNAAIAPGVKLLLHRHHAKPDWPYVDTKFNPNTGKNLPPSCYKVLYTWFLGRGTQSLDAHLPWIDQLTSLSSEEKAQAKDLFAGLVTRMADAMVKVVQTNRGRCPFRVNLDFKAANEQGEPVEFDSDDVGAGDIFVAKGLIAQGSDVNVRLGLDMIVQAAEAIRDNRYGAQQFVEQPKDIGQGPKMLMQDMAGLLCRKTDDSKLRATGLAVAAEFMQSVLDDHCDAATAVFAEYIDAKTKQRKSYLDPGHANEFVGLGLDAVAAMAAETASLTDDRRALLARARREMPRLLLKSCEHGWNATYRGLHKAVDTQTGEVLNDDMPWWNLPETMRAAAFACGATDDGAIKQQCLEWLRQAHNAYFEKYLNPDNMLFPYQTISGATGQVVDKTPAVPEGDPLYHTNLALLEMLDVLDRL